MYVIAGAVAGETLNGREVIVAIVGGTMLTIALTRPRLRWAEQLTRHSPRGHLYAERALTALALAMASYAGFSVSLVLHRHISAQADALLDGAACFLGLYAALVNFEPFIHEWRLSDGLRAIYLYLLFGATAGLLGMWIAVVVLEPSFPVRSTEAIGAAFAVILVLWLLLYPRARRPPQQPALPLSWAGPVTPKGPPSRATSATGSSKTLPATTRTPVRSTRASRRVGRR